MIYLSFGKIVKFDFTPKSHFELGENLKMLDFDFHMRRLKYSSAELNFNFKVKRELLKKIFQPTFALLKPNQRYYQYK